MILDLAAFVESRQVFWNELDSMGKSLREDVAASMDLARASRFHELYELACADLVRARSFAGEPALVRRLELLVSSAYAQIHESRRALRWNFWRWLVADAPAAFRRRAGAFLLSFAVMMGGAAVGGGMVAADSSSKRHLLPFAHLMQSPSQRVAEEEKGNGPEGPRATFASFLMTHNIRVTLLSFCLGITGGLGTFLLEFYNGVILGAVCIDYILDGQALFLAGWLLPHGSVEIPAVLIGGQAGFLVAFALLSRRQGGLGGRLRKILPDLAHLTGFAAFLLVYAGIIESFFSQLHAPVVPYAAKIAVGVAHLGLLLLWALRLGRVR